MPALGAEFAEGSRTCRAPLRPARTVAALQGVGFGREPGVSPYPSAVALLEFSGELTWTSPAVLRSRVPALLERIGLADCAREPIARFSKGMLKRLAPAQALLAEPDLLVLDEPMDGLERPVPPRHRGATDPEHVPANLSLRNPRELPTLVWTAGFLPTFLEPGMAAVLLARPLARWELLLGKCLGALTFAGFQVVLFVVPTWLALG